MAGDWLKIEVCTPDKPEVIGIADMLGIVPAHAFGSLFMVWRWFDQHTTEGNASYVTKVTIDRLSGNAGFADAMAKVGWLTIHADGTVALPHFDRHNGETAKQRGLTAKRVAKSKLKSNDCGNASVTVSALPREEKRREEKKDTVSASRGSRLAADFELSPEWGNEALSVRDAWNNSDVIEEFASFKDYWIAQPGKKGVKTDWLATWRNWCRNSYRKGEKI